MWLLSRLTKELRNINLIFSMIFWIDNSIPEDQLERTFFGTMISLFARLRDHFYHGEKSLTGI